MNNPTFEDGQLLKVVHIKSPADYPKKDGIYFCCRSGFLTVQKLLANPPTKSFMREISWYVQPIDITVTPGEFLKKTTHSDTMYSSTAYIERRMQEYLDFIKQQ